MNLADSRSPSSATGVHFSIVSNPATPAWHAVRTQRKHEHIAAAHLSHVLGLEVFAARLRFRRSTRSGPAWVTEALFPSYIFVRCVAESFPAVRAAAGVLGLIQFGMAPAIVPDLVIDCLRAEIGHGEIHTIPPAFTTGMEVEITEGALKGLRGVLTKILPAGDRVKILLEFLGRTVETEVLLPALIAEPAHPLAA